MGGLVGLLWLIVAILVVAWIVGFVLVHVTSWAIHLLIVAAIIVALWNLFMGQRRAV